MTSFSQICNGLTGTKNPSNMRRKLYDHVESTRSHPRTSDVYHKFSPSKQRSFDQAYDLWLNGYESSLVFTEDWYDDCPQKDKLLLLTSY